MTLRTRLTAAFLAVVLGPVLLGAAFVNYTVDAAARDRSVHTLDVATAATRSAVANLCQQLRTAAELVAAQPPERLVATAETVIDQLPVTTVRVMTIEGTRTIPADGPARPWARCGGPVDTSRDVGAIAARASSPPVGEVWAAAGLDRALVERLARAAGVAVTLLGHPASGPLHTTDPAVESSLAAAEPLAAGDVAEGADGQWVRRLEPSDGQPLPLVLAAPRAGPDGLATVLGLLVVLTGVLAVLLAWRLARTTTRPLADLARAADRVAEGDLSVRVAVTGSDEAGRLAAAFNRMTHRTQAYVQALTASRDQLRAHLTVLGHTLSSTHDLDRILRVILESALVATGAGAGAVLLVDPAGRTLTGHATGAAGPPTDLPAAGGVVEFPTPAGVPAAGGPADSSPLGDGHSGDDPADRTGHPGGDTVVDGDGHPGGAVDGDGGYPDPDRPWSDQLHRDEVPLTVPLGSGLLGTVAASGQAQRGRVSQTGPALHGAEPRCRTYLVVPISGPAAGQMPVVRGVLAVYDRLGGDEFDDSDLVTLQTFAGQAAVAVNNVHTHQEVQRLSMTDPLTGLWNYRSLQESIHREVERANRFDHPLAVLMLDLDRFKEVNDAYGHPAGDAVLAEFGQRIRARIREVDLAFRHGGEEFVIILPETDGRGATVLAQRLGAAVRDRPVMITLRNSATRLPIRISVSIGIAVYPEHGSTPDTLLDAADDALYAAKAAGRDTYRTAAHRPDQPDGSGRPDPDAGPVRPERTGGGPANGLGGDPDCPSGGAQPPRQTRGR